MAVDLVQVRKLCRELDRLERELEELFGFNEPAKSAPPPPKVPKGTAQPCCGSKGRRHKKDCPGAVTKPQQEGLKRYKCTDCDHPFEDECEYMDAVCPKCGSTSVVQKH